MCTKHHACRSAKVALNPSHEASCSNPKIANIQMEGISEVDSDVAVQITVLVELSLPMRKATP